MCGVRNQDLLARVAFGLMEGAHHQQAGEFPVRSGGGLQSDGVHAGDFDQTFAERLHDAQGALRNLLRLVGVAVGQTFEARHHFVDARVVFHGAGAEGIHAKIDGVVPGRHAGEVADDFDLADFGHVAKVFALRRAQEFGDVDFRYVEWWKLPGRFTGRGFLKDQTLVLIDVAGGFGSRCASPGHLLDGAFATGLFGFAFGQHTDGGIDGAARGHFGATPKRSIAEFRIELLERESANQFVAE